MRKVAAVLCCLLLVASSCDHDDDGTTAAGPGSTTTTSAPGEDPEATTTTTASPTESTTSTSIPCPANTNPQAADAVSPRAYHTAVRAAHRPESGFDRIVFEFRDAVPGFRVEYIPKPVIADGSGDEVPVQGRYVLGVRLEDATGWDFEAAQPTYTGSRRIKPATKVVREIVQSGDFEGQLNWAIGMDAKTGFRVRQLTNPYRVMIEICTA